jgi:hypothetical protein
MELHLKITGYLLVVLSLIHIIFPRYFNWKKELAPLSLINRQMMYVHMFFIALVVLLMGVLCICCSDDIVHTKLGQQLSLGLFIFWAARLIFQFLVYSPKLWKGKTFETIVHVLFSILWVYVSIVFLLIYLGR